MLYREKSGWIPHSIGITSDKMKRNRFVHSLVLYSLKIQSDKSKFAEKMDMDFNEIKQLYHIKTNKGVPKSLIEFAEKKWSNIPTVLSDYYKQFGGYKEITNGVFVLHRPDKLHKVADEYLCFMEEYQGDTCWGINIADLHKDNPPVYIWEGTDICQLESPSLYAFLIGKAYAQALFTLPYTSESPRIISEDVIQKIDTHLNKKQFSFFSTPDHVFYGNEKDDIVRLCSNGKYTSIEYASADKKHFASLEKLIFG